MDRSAFVFILLLVSIVSGEKYKATFWDTWSTDGNSIKIDYEENKCINLPSAWQKRSGSVTTGDNCIQVYMQLDCHGSPTYLSLSNNLDHHKLTEYNLEKEVASFKKCDSNSHTRFKLDERPRYTMSVKNKTGGVGSSYTIRVTSGECHPIPEQWQNPNKTIAKSYKANFVLYEKDACTGKSEYTGTLLHTLGAGKTGIYWNKHDKSVQTCDLEFHGECKPVTCPKYLHEKSNEYAFWKFFFSTYRKHYQDQFEERVKKSNDGFISWDFLFSPNISASSRGDQYQDAFEILHLILLKMFESKPGQLGFNKKDIVTLSDLAKTIHKERRDELSKYAVDVNDHNYAVIRQMKTLWYMIEYLFGRIEDVWQIYGESSVVTLFDYEDEGGPNIKLECEDDKCINLPLSWQNRAMSANIHSTCIKVYRQLNCQGNATYLHRGYSEIPRLGAFAMDEKIVSLQKCERNLFLKMDERPQYAAQLYESPNGYGRYYHLYLTTGKCQTLPVEWHSRVASIAMPYWSCFVLYDGPKCTGNKKSMNSLSTGTNSLKDINFSNVIKSAKTCKLEFQGECDPGTCPKYLYKGSEEFAFWRYLFSTYSRTYQVKFEEQIKTSNDGLISWEFLFAQNQSSSSKGDQYLDAFGFLHRLLFNLVEGKPGKLGFNTKDIVTLSDMAKAIYKDRAFDYGWYNGNWWNQDQNYAVIRHMKLLWSETDKIIDKIIHYWSPEDYSNICGLVEPQPVLHGTRTLISDGAEAVYGEDPWHAAIYRKRSKVLICGATIISPSVLLSAAHCFFSESLIAALNDTSEYEIYVAKFTRTYSTRDGDGKSQKIHKIKELIFSPNGFNSVLTNTYGADIILIILEEPLKYNRFVRPACIDWDGSVFRDTFDKQNVLGRVVGWGITTNGSIEDIRDASERLQVAKLPYISNSDCKGEVKELTSDKFCGGAQTGASVQAGDSGGGFVFRSGERYYLRGIVSTRDAQPNSSISAFTDIQFYLSWIQKYF